MSIQHNLMFHDLLGYDVLSILEGTGMQWLEKKMSMAQVADYISQLSRDKSAEVVRAWRDWRAERSGSTKTRSRSKQGKKGQAASSTPRAGAGSSEPSSGGSGSQGNRRSSQQRNRRGGRGGGGGNRGTCFNCGEAGHYRRDCPKAAAATALPQTHAISIPLAGEATDLPASAAEGGGAGRPVNANLVEDTGEVDGAGSGLLQNTSGRVGPAHTAEAGAVTTSAARGEHGKSGGAGPLVDRLWRVKARYQPEEPNASERVVNVFLDSGSSITLLAPSVLEREERYEPPITARTMGGTFELDTVGQCTVALKDERDQWVSVKIRGFRSENIPGGCSILLGSNGIRHLGIDLRANDARSGDALPWLRGRPESGGRPIAPEELGAGFSVVCCWSDLQMAQYIAREPRYLEEKVTGFQDVDVNPDLDPDFRARILEIVQAKKEAFGTSDLPPVNKIYEDRFGPIDAASMLKEDARPVQCRRPNWKPNVVRYLSRFAQRYLDEGLLERNDASPWAMRVTIASKGDGSPRICLDLRPANSQFKARTGEYNNGVEELFQTSVALLYRIEADNLSAYFQYPVKAGPSRDIFTFWLPIWLNGEVRVSKFSFTRLPFGWLHSPIFLQRHMNIVRASMRPETKKYMAQFFDDWQTGVVKHRRAQEQFLLILDDFLNAMISFGVVLKPSKCRLGYPTGTFYGFRLALDGSNSLSEEFLASLNDIATPRTLRDFQSLMGTLNVARDYIDHYAVVVKPIQQQVRASRAPEWTPECQVALQDVIALLRQRVRRYTPNFDYPLHLATDASDDGAGGHLYQWIPLDDVVADDGRPEVVEQREKPDGTVCPMVRRTIGFFSKAFDELLRNQPVFYREAYALLYFLDKIKLFALSSPFPVQVETDHVSLQWVKHNHKGRVTSFLLNQLEDVQFEVKYVGGTSREIACPDSQSRYPMLGPRLWAWAGLERMFQLLLQSIRAAVVAAEKLWVYAREDARKLASVVRRERRGATRARIVHNSPSAVDRWPKVDVAILAPPAADAPRVCAHMLVKSIRGACLVPQDLVWEIPRVASEVDRDRVRNALLNDVCFVGSWSSGFVWISEHRRGRGRRGSVSGGRRCSALRHRLGGGCGGCAHKYERGDGAGRL